MEDKLKLKNYAGYALCDIGGMLAFSAIGAYFSVFCTDILKISATAVFAILLAARIWDGINDPIMGALVSSKRPGKSGKYRPFLLWGGIPLAISSVFVFLKLNGLTETQYIVYAACAYIIYGMLYTVVLVPYGSLASVMTVKENERSLLSICRSIGGGVASLAISMIFPMYVLVNNVLDYDRLIIAMIGVAAVMMLMYLLSFKWTREVIPPQQNPQKVGIFKILAGLCKNRTFVIMSLLGCLHMAVSMYYSTVNVYLFKDYYGKSGMITLLTIISYLPMVVMIPFINPMIKRFGKKEICVVGIAIAAIASLAIFLLRAENPWIYIVANFFVNVGVGFMTLEIWAMAADVIDHQEWVTHERREAANYAAFTFMRKIGQAIAALAPFFVGLVGYDSELVGLGQNAGTLDGMYTVSTLVPFIIFVFMFVLILAYPLDKRTSDRMRDELAELRSSYGEPAAAQPEGEETGI